jgi:DNA (cytosine-5)-methyltransferase 1
MGVKKDYAKNGTSTSWYRPMELSDEERAVFRERSINSQKAKARAMAGKGEPPIHPINNPNLDPNDLMPQLPVNGIRSLSLFSGGGGLDLGFDRAGFNHVASYEMVEPMGKTLSENRSEWKVYAGEDGDVIEVDWKQYKGQVDVIHGGPPCQPFSLAGRQQGKDDSRNMFPEFIRAVYDIKPKAFVAENVPALMTKKFQGYLEKNILKPLGRNYSVTTIALKAEYFGIPQSRTRVFFIGFKNKKMAAKFKAPSPTHSAHHMLAYRKNGNGKQLPLDLNVEDKKLKACMDVREALGLPDIGFKALAPTIRSSLTGPRHTTSILSSTAALKLWNELQIWPNGVQLTRERAHQFVAKNGHFRLSVPDVALIQGFPESWHFHGASYMALGQIGNAVPPPLAYSVAKSVAGALK